MPISLLVVENGTIRTRDTSRTIERGGHYKELYENYVANKYIKFRIAINNQWKGIIYNPSLKNDIPNFHHFIYSQPL